MNHINVVVARCSVRKWRLFDKNSWIYQKQ